jgi:serine protease Do
MRFLLLVHLMVIVIRSVKALSVHDTNLAAVLNVPQPAAYLVQHVAKNSIADQIGIRGGSLPTTIHDSHILLGGDIIVEMLGVTIENKPETFKKIREKLSLLNHGDKIIIKVLRQGKIMTLSTHLSEKY